MDACDLCYAETYERKTPESEPCCGPDGWGRRSSLWEWREQTWRQSNSWCWQGSPQPAPDTHTYTLQNYLTWSPSARLIVSFWGGEIDSFCFFYKSWLLDVADCVQLFQNSTCASAERCTELHEFATSRCKTEIVLQWIMQRLIQVNRESTCLCLSPNAMWLLPWQSSWHTSPAPHLGSWRWPRWLSTGLSSPCLPSWAWNPPKWLRPSPWRPLPPCQWRRSLWMERLWEIMTDGMS